MSLYSITEGFIRLIAAIETGEIPEEAIADTLEAVSGEWEERADAVLSSIKNLRALVDDIRAEEKTLAERRKRKEKTVERLERYFTDSLQRIGRSSYESARHSVRFTSSASVVVDDLDALIKYAKDNDKPELLRTVTEVSANKDEVKKLLKNGDVAGARIEYKSNIQIK